MQRLLNKVPQAVLATSTTNGLPNAVPVGAKKIIDEETVIISDQYLNKTLSNMKSNPRISLMFWQGKEGYQLKGAVTVETSGKIFEETAIWLKQRAREMGLRRKSKGAIILKIEEIYGISSGPKAGRRLA
jgi:predicted pyridoxine 5'-phosphate oxidase superfamily flavin-nucleotide-binding protein